MRNHSILPVNQLLTEHTIDAVIESQSRLHTCASPSNGAMTSDYTSSEMDLSLESSKRKLVECRICHDEDQDSSMETPCACCGSLKYAHRSCVQRWCNEKGNTICEICLQPFKPGYTSPPQHLHFSGVPMNFRGNWEISRRDIFNLQFPDMVATDHDPLESDYDDYIASSSTSILCCRIVSICFIVLLVLRHTLPFIVNGSGEYSITLLFMLHLLRFIGILLPLYIMARAFMAAQHLQQQSDHRDFMTDEENDLPQRLSHI